LKKALDYFHQAIEIDPTYALAHGGLAECYIPLGVYCHLAPSDAFPKARAAAEMALQIDPDLTEARIVVAAYTTDYEWKPYDAERDLRAIAVSRPKYSRARQALAWALTVTRRFAEAETEARGALDVDPLALSLNAFMTMVYCFSRRFDEAVHWGRRTIDMDANFYPGYFHFGLSCQMSGRFDEAIEALGQARLLSSDSTLMIAALGGAYAAAGREQNALGVLDELRTIAKRKYVSQAFVGAIHAALGHDGEALACLEQAERDRCYWLLPAVAVDPRFDRLRADPRFKALAGRMGVDD
jgi:serine/threonine-protein kinase